MGKISGNSKRKIILFIAMVIIVVVVLGGITYAFFVPSTQDTANETLSVTSGNLKLIFRDNSAEITPNINGTWNFGDSIEKEVAIENKGTEDLYAQILWENLVNTYLPESLTYTLEEKSSETGATYKKVVVSRENVPQSTTASTQELANSLLVPAGKTNIYKITVTLEDLSDIDQTVDLNASFITKFTLRQGTKSLLSEIASTAKTTNPNFANPATTDETKDGLYSIVDDSGNPSYYYRGAVNNNYVKFGIDKDGNDMYWRIIRFNGDGSMRMQYDGAGTADDPNYAYTRGFALTSKKWNTKNDDAKYVGWMFGGAQGVASTSKAQAQKNETDSDIKAAVDTWYEDNLLNNYHKYIADEIFCNDRSTPGPSQSVSGWGGDTGLGYAQNFTTYGTYKRFIMVIKGEENAMANPQPSFVCEQSGDKFTVNESSGGNGKSKYPVGLITVDEIVAAGSGKWQTVNESYYLNKGTAYWSSSPGLINSTASCMFAVFMNGKFGNSFTNSGYAVAPVINIKPEYVSQLVGNGTAGNPFRLSSE